MKRKSRFAWECRSKRDIYCCNEYLGGKIHQKLNKNQKPIVKKYREGKMKKNFEKRVKST